MKDSSKKGLILAIILHLVVVILVSAGVFFSSLFQKEDPSHVFLMESPAQIKKSVAKKQSPSKKIAKIAKKAPEPKKEILKPKDFEKPKEKPKEIANTTPNKTKNTVSYEDFLKKTGKTKSNKIVKKVKQKKVAAPKLSVPDVTQALATSFEGEITIKPIGDASEFDQYSANLKHAIDESWVEPKHISGKDLKAIVDFSVSPLGHFEDIKIISSSGNASFDESVLAAFKKLRAYRQPPNRKKCSFQLTFSEKKA